MHESTDALRNQLVRVLAWDEAHVSFDKAVAEIPPDKRGARVTGVEHSLWQLLEHMRLAQDDILDFCINPRYKHTMAWPDDYWPADPAPPSAKAWTDSIEAYTRSREELQRLAREAPDLTAKVPTGKENQTFLRALLLVADHTAYHVGQLVMIRRALGIWK